MPDAFGNVWPQYQAGWRQTYAPPQGAVPIQPMQPGPASTPSPGPLPGAGAPFVGAPLGGSDYPDQPVGNPSELSGQGTQDTSMLSSSGAGEPQTRYELAYKPGLSNIGGFTGAGGTGGTGMMDVMGSLLGGLSGDMSKKGQGGGGGGVGAGGGEAGYPYDLNTTAGIDAYLSDGGGGASGAAGAAGGAGGLSGGQLGGLASDAIMGFAKAVQQAMAPVSVNPSEWASPPPQPMTFSWPSLSPNAGGTAPWA